MGRQDYETETMVAHPLLAKGNDSHDESKETYIAFDCKASGQNGFGVGQVAPTLRAMGHLNTPIVPIPPFTLAIRGRGDSHQLEYRQDGTANAVLTPNGGRAGIGVGAIAFDTTQITSATNGSSPKAGDPCHPLAAGGHAPAIAFNPKMGGDPTMGTGVNDDGTAYTIDTDGRSNAVAQGWAVRRLTPTECERLQGFPDNFTNVPWGKKDTSPDGPRYKALGNSMAVNVMRWIGQRIDRVEAILQGMEEAA